MKTIQNNIILRISRLLNKPEETVIKLITEDRERLGRELYITLRVERKKGEEGHWSYNFYKHRSLYKIYKEYFETRSGTFNML